MANVPFLGEGFRHVPNEEFNLKARVRSRPVHVGFAVDKMTLRQIYGEWVFPCWHHSTSAPCIHI